MIHYSRWVETIQKSINRQMDKQNVVYVAILPQFTEDKFQEPQRLPEPQIVYTPSFFFFLTYIQIYDKI